ncbi:type VI secretion system protein TssA [Desulfatitalea tepidiphila]|uniref:type VI secretion system protein TssA n=1 Tax=Desulfatitalea tepidiphila TaxID=1185843 RepID=UPI0006B664D4|nr:type VI secretion system protein TssA [Desulfatitalea tepidiphila]
MDLTTLGIVPIPGDHPAGSDVRYEPVFEQLQAEIDKLSSPSASGQVDWARVEEYGIEILSSKSKDLTVACYLAAALVINRRIEGLDAGLNLLKDLLETFWDQLYPPKKRMRGRNGAITWWLDRMEVELQKLSPAPLSAELVERLKTHVKRIDAVLSEKMPDAPMMRSLERSINAFPVQEQQETPPDGSEATVEAGGVAGTAAAAVRPAVSPPAPAEENRVAPAAQESGVPGAKIAPQVSAASDGALDGAITDEVGARRGADAAFQRLRQVSLFLLQQDYKNPLAYRYRRIACWAKLTTLPPNADGVTQIPPPAPQVISALETLRTEGNLSALIQNAEQKLSQFIFWLDLNRWVVEALDGLGGGCQLASSAVSQATADLATRLPGLASLRFSDGMPFADPATAQWVQGLETAAPAVGVSRPPTANREDGDDLLGAKIQEAASLAGKKQLSEAVGLLQEEMRRSASRRQSLQWRLAIVRLFMEMKKISLALPHLDQVLADIDAYRLEVWEPDLALEGLTTAWQAYGAGGNNDLKARAAELLDRIALLDAAAAVRLSR